MNRVAADVPGRFDRARALRIACAVLLGVTACKRTTTPPGLPRVPRMGGELRLLEEPNIASWDPLEAGDIVSQGMVSQVYDALVEYAPRAPYKPVPALARAWEVEGTTWTFHVRPAARYADDACFPHGRGRRVLAADVRYTFERQLRAGRSRQLPSPMWKLRGARDFLEGRSERLAGLRTPDDSTVVFELTETSPSFIHLVALQVIVPREAVEYYGSDFWQHPVGAGPFRLARWTPQESVVLVRNENYWQRDERGTPLPYLDRIVLYLVPPRALPEAVDLHVVPRWSGSAAGQRFASLGVRELEVTRYNVIFLCWNFSRSSPWTRDPLLRHAVSRAIRRRSGVSAVPARGLLPPGLAGYDSTRSPLGPDPRGAARLLAEAGYPEGAGLPRLRIHCIREETSMMRYTIAPLESLGVHCELVPVAKAQYWQLMPQTTLDLFRFGWIAEHPDPESLFGLFYSGSPDSFAHYHDAFFDSLFETATREADPKRRAGLYQAMEERLLEQMPAVFLHHDRNVLHVREDVRGFEHSVNPMWKKRYKYVWLESTS
ncbi:MAG: ABC transporter substrate-binding protein [Candidatus Krumholzibacteriia bacterium]